MGKKQKNVENSVGQAIRNRRRALKLSQNLLARIAGTTTSAISNIETGIRSPSSGTLARVAKALGCTADDLLAGVAADSRDSAMIQQVVAGMKSLPMPAQKEIVEFCEYLKHRQRKLGT